MKNLTCTSQDFQELLKAASAVADALGETLEGEMAAGNGDLEDVKNSVVVLEKLDAILNKHSEYLLS